MEINFEIFGVDLTDEQEETIKNMVERGLVWNEKKLKKPASEAKVFLFFDSTLETYSGSVLNENDDEIMDINGKWSQDGDNCTFKLI